MTKQPISRQTYWRGVAPKLCSLAPGWLDFWDTVVEFNTGRGGGGGEATSHTFDVLTTCKAISKGLASGFGTDHAHYVKIHRSTVLSNLDPELFCACRGEGSRALGNPGARFVSDWFQQKTIKVFLIGLFKFARERLNVRRVWRVSGFFP